MFQHKENAEMLIGIDEKQAILLIYNHNVGNFRNISSISNTPPPPHTHTLYVWTVVLQAIYSQSTKTIIFAYIRGERWT